MAGTRLVRSSRVLAPNSPAARVPHPLICLAMLAGITAAVVGVMANLAIWFGWRLLDAQQWPATWLALAIAALAYLGLSRWRWPMAAVVAGAAATGAVAQLVVPLAA